MIYDKLVNVLKNGYVQKYVQLSEHTSFKVGGPCEYMAFPSSTEEISGVVGVCRKEGVPYYILGNGSNVIALDEGYRGVIIKLGKNFNNIEGKGMNITAQAGASLASVSRKALELELTGLEFASGIPGSVGGGVMMNAGAYDGELKQVIKNVTAISPNGSINVFPCEDCGFSYRHSVFQDSESIVLETEFELEKGESKKISDKMSELMKKRNEKQPLHYPSAGSAFKRPEGNFAGKLIQDCGLKGLTIGGAQVSEMHSGFIINKGGATASDILNLIELVKNTVYDRFGIMLQTEVRVIE